MAFLACAIIGAAAAAGAFFLGGRLFADSPGMRRAVRIGGVAFALFMLAAGGAVEFGRSLAPAFARADRLHAERIGKLCDQWGESPRAIEAANEAGAEYVRGKVRGSKFSSADMLSYVEAIDAAPRPGQTYRDRVLEAAALFERDYADRDFLRAVSDESARLKRFESRSGQ